MHRKKNLLFLPCNMAAVQNLYFNIRLILVHVLLFSRFRVIKSDPQFHHVLFFPSPSIPCWFERWNVTLNTDFVSVLSIFPDRLKVKIDARTYFDNDISVSKSMNLDKLAKAGTVVDKTE